MASHGWHAYRSPPDVMNRSALVLLASLACAGSLHATLIGDQITIRRSYPNLATDFASPVTTVVTAGASDAVSPQPYYYAINPEAENIHIDFHVFSGFAGYDGGVFDGLQFLDIDSRILGVSVVQATGINVVDLEYGADYIHINFNGWFGSNSYVNLQVLTEDPPVAAVPEPSTFALAALGIGALALASRRRRPA